MGKRGRQPVAKHELFAVAQTLYRDFRRLVYGWPHSPHGKTTGSAGELDDSALAVLSDKDKAEIEAQVDKEIVRGYYRPSDRQQRLRAIEQEFLDSFKETEASEWMWNWQKKRVWDGQPDMFYSLVHYTSRDVLYSLCQGAFRYHPVKNKAGVTRTAVVRHWPIPRASLLPRYITQYWKEFAAAKKDSRFPRSKRPTTQEKQMWFLARALAGAAFGLQPRTAINLIGSTRPEQLLEKARDAKPSRKRANKRTK